MKQGEIRNSMRRLECAVSNARKNVEEMRKTVRDRRSITAMKREEELAIADLEKHLESLSISLRRVDAVGLQAEELFGEYDRAAAEAYELVKALVLNQ